MCLTQQLDCLDSTLYISYRPKDYELHQWTKIMNWTVMFVKSNSKHLLIGQVGQNINKQVIIQKVRVSMKHHINVCRRELQRGDKDIRVEQFTVVEKFSRLDLLCFSTLTFIKDRVEYVNRVDQFTVVKQSRIKQKVVTARNLISSSATESFCQVSCANASFIALLKHLHKKLGKKIQQRQKK